MGTDKAFVTVDGVAMVTRAARALADAGADSVTIIGGDHARVTSLGLVHVADRYPGEGPLGGIITGLGHVPNVSPAADRTVILACDLIRPSSLGVGSVLGPLSDDTVDVVVPLINGHAQWMHSAWRVRSLAALSRAFHSGVRAPRHAVADLVVSEVLDADPAWFADADVPADLPSLPDDSD